MEFLEIDYEHSDFLNKYKRKTNYLDIQHNKIRPLLKKIYGSLYDKIEAMPGVQIIG